MGLAVLRHMGQAKEHPADRNAEPARGSERIRLSEQLFPHRVPAQLIKPCWFLFPAFSHKEPL